MDCKKQLGIIAENLRHSGRPEYSNKIEADVIHIICLSIAEGILPGAYGNGHDRYTVRKAIRRMFCVRSIALNYRPEEPFLFRLVPAIASKTKEIYPTIYQKSDFIAEVIRLEEEAFLRYSRECDMAMIEDIKSRRNESRRNERVGVLLRLFRFLFLWILEKDKSGRIYEWYEAGKLPFKKFLFENDGINIKRCCLKSGTVYATFIRPEYKAKEE